MSKVLITGGSGFIGGHLTEELVKQGYQVIVYDSLRTGKTQNLNGIPHRFIEGDICNYATLVKAVRDCEIVFHLAALTSVAESMANIDECVAINLHGTLNILKASRENQVKKLVFASSAAVYGESPDLPKTETMRLDPKSPYAITKADGEFYCNLFHESFGLPTVCARFFNVFGERQDPHSDYASAIPIFIARALKNEPVIIYGDGTQTRDFVYVKDIVKALLLLKDHGFGVYNIGYGKTIDLNTLVALIRSLIHFDATIQYEPERSGEIKHSYASVAKIKSLGFKPDYTLEDGLKRTIQEFKKYNI
jgi:UDP-glucose 4-epimerase